MRFFRKKESPLPLTSTDMAAAVYCKVFHLSETGPSRNSNEDSIYFTWPGNQGDLFAMVADGMGGHNAGEVASGIACSTAQAYLQAHYHEKDPNNMLKQMTREANKAIRSAASQNPAYSGMGTTSTILFIHDGHMYFSQVGDSRLYLYRDGQLTQCTIDQTLVNKMVKEGSITATEAEHHSMKNVLVQALGSVVEVEPELSKTGMAIIKGDRFFLCSDGIYDVLDKQELAALLSLPEPSFVMECIKALGMQRIASDNFSAILVEVTDEKPPEPVGTNNLPATKEQNVLI